MDPKKDIPPEMQLTASAAVAARRKAIISSDLEFGERLLDLRLRQLREVLSTVGEDRYPHYAELRRRTRLRVRSLGTETTLGAPRSAARVKARHDILDGTHQALSDLGIAGDRIKNIRRQYAKVALSAVEASMSEGRRFAGARVPLAAQIIIPPYPYDTSYTSDWGDPTSVRTAIATVDKVTGDIRTSTTVSIFDAGDSDVADARATGAVLIPFVLPSAGRLMVTMSLVARNVLYYGQLSDEWGFSELYGRLWLRCYANVVNPVVDLMGGEQIQNYTVVLDGEDEFSWYQNPFDAGHGQDWIFTSDQGYAAGTWVLLECGVSQRNYVWLNDFTYYSGINSDWMVKSVSVDVVP